MEYIIYPLIKKEKVLPFYVTCIGETDRQCHINRRNGFNDPQIIFCSGGRGRLAADDEEYEITSGRAFFLPADAPHEYMPAGNVWETHFVAFSGYASELLLRQLNLTSAEVVSIEKTEIDNIFRRMLNALRTDKLYGSFTASALLYEFILEFHRGASGIFADENSGILTAAIEYIDKHFSEPLELDQLSSIAGISTQYFCRVFKKTTGMRPFEYVADKRIQLAKFLLDENQRTIKEIAELTGYSDPNYFSTVFRKKVGMSPKEYLRRSERFK